MPHYHSLFAFETALYFVLFYFIDSLDVCFVFLHCPYGHCLIFEHLYLPFINFFVVTKPYVLLYYGFE